VPDSLDETTEVPGPESSSRPGGTVAPGLDLIYRSAYDRARSGAPAQVGYRARRPRGLDRVRAALARPCGTPGPFPTRRDGEPWSWLRWATASLGARDAACGRPPEVAAPGQETKGTTAAVRPDLAVVVTGVVPAGPGGMRDYGDLLGRELTERGARATVAWHENTGGPLAGLQAGLRLLATAWRIEAGTVVIWNYAPVSLGAAGIPGPGLLLGLVLRVRGTRTVAVLHEMAQPLGLPGCKAKVVAAGQLIALGAVLAGVPDVVATTQNRARWLRLFERTLGFRAHFLPVFSNFDPPRSGRAHNGAGGRSPAEGPLAVVLDYAADYARPDVVIDAARALARRAGIDLVLLGAPGAESRTGARWRALAEAAGVPERLRFTGVVDPEEFARWLSRADVVILPNAQGPSSRKGTLAAALAHGSVIVSVDGLLRWQRLVDADALVVVPPRGASMASAIERLWESTDLRRCYRRRAAEFYDEHLSLQRVTDGIVGILSQGGATAGPARHAKVAGLGHESSANGASRLRWSKTGQVP